MRCVLLPVLLVATGALAPACSIREVHYARHLGSDADAPDETTAVDASAALYPPKRSEDGRYTFVDTAGPILHRWCADCHLADATGQCRAGTCFVDVYASMLAPRCCSKLEDVEEGCKSTQGVTLTLGWCTLLRIQGSNAPNSKNKLRNGNSIIVVPDDEVAMLKAWLDAGSPEN